MFNRFRLLRVATNRMSKITSDAGLLAQLNVYSRRLDALEEETRGMRTMLRPMIDYLQSKVSGQLPRTEENGVVYDVPSRKRVLTYDIEPKPLPKLETKRKKEAPEGHHLDEEGYVIVHTDGACSSNGQAGARAGIGIWWSDSSRNNVSRAVAGGRHTNNTAEIQAATVAIVEARKHRIKKLNIHTDSMFLINCITIWIKNWKVNSWKTKDKKPVKNKEDLTALDAEISKGDVQVKWTHVKGHAGILGNERADRLAVAGAMKAE